LLSPDVGKLWTAKDILPGLYIVLTGKVRLLDAADEMIVALGAMQYFGEYTFFPTESIAPYTARASMDVQICFLPQEKLTAVVKRHPAIHQHLWATVQERGGEKSSANNDRSSTPDTARSNIRPVMKNLVSLPPDRASKKISRAYFPSPQQKAGHLWQRIAQRYPYYAQQSASDCGAACLVMVTRYWGKKFSVNRLRDIANVDRNGSSLKGISVAAESVGFTSRPVKATLDRLAEQPLPAIAHWQGKHYIVVYAITKKQVIIADPAIGQRTLSHAEFKKDWTGYVMILQPTAMLREAEETTTPFWQFFELLRPHSLVVAEIFVASLFIQIFGLITPLFTQFLLDQVVVQKSELTLFTVGFGLFIFSMFKVAMTGLRQYLLDHTANRLDLALIVAFIRHTMRLPLGFFESRYVGDIMSRVQENQKIQRFLSGEATTIFLDLITTFVYVGLMFWYSWQMALLSLLIVPPFLLLPIISTPFLRRISREIFSAYAEENSYLIQALTGIKTVKSTAVEQNVRWNWEELFHKAVKTSFAGEIISNRLQIFSNTINAVVSTGMLCFGTYQVIHNQLTIGQLVAFNMLLGNVIQPFQRLTVLWNQLQEVIIAVERINDVLDAEPEEDLRTQARQALPPIRGHIRFENVTFRYHPEGDENVLENLSFEVEPGQMVALIGRSGSGKTTISKLVLGLYPATDGRILIDGYDLASLSLHSLRKQTGVVDQDTFMFGGTIRENISLSKPGASLTAVIEAAELAGADEFIRKLPMAYETQIGEGGGLLSGGQRQRIAIARALLGNSPLLIMDEATSHLDPESERIIQQNLSTILKNRTTLVIAHRLSTIRNADKILVLDRGILVEQGTHAELIAKRGHYYYFNQQQLEPAETY
jgi:HlyB family type I secretion system ABC transporter